MLFGGGRGLEIVMRKTGFGYHLLFDLEKKMLHYFKFNKNQQGKNEIIFQLWLILNGKIKAQS